MTATTKVAKRITLAQARKIFESVAPSEEVSVTYACPVLERTRYWNWFRIGMRLVQSGKISKRDKDWVNTDPRPLNDV